MIETLKNKNKEQLQEMMSNFEKLNKHFLQEVTITDEISGHCFETGQRVLMVDVIDTEIPLYVATDLRLTQYCVIQEEEFVVQ